ncbi:MAG: MXAN_5187 C-terminal domain-containing protein [Myxococcaceae bacterium]
MAEKKLDAKATTETLTQACESVEAAMAELRALYDQYFLGVDRHPPNAKHHALTRQVQKLRSEFVRSTAMRFQIASLFAKFQTYERLWTRTIQEIEAGTYKRDLFKAKRRQAEREAQKEKPKAIETPAAPPSRPQTEPPDGLSDSKVNDIFRAYVEAKKRCNEDVSKLSVDGLAATLRKQVPDLMKRHGAKSIEFKVVVKDGKAVLRAVPKTK